MAPSNASVSPSLSPISKKEEMRLNLTQILHKMPHYQDVVFKPLEMAKPFAPTIQLPPEVNIESS
jgi:hypothetical protein